DLIDRDGSMGGQGGARAIDPKRREEDLEGKVRVESARDLADLFEILVDEATDAVVVFERALAAAPADEERALWKTEIALNVDQHEVIPAHVGRRGKNVILATKECRRL